MMSHALARALLAAPDLPVAVTAVNHATGPGDWPGKMRAAIVTERHGGEHRDIVVVGDLILSDSPLSGWTNRRDLQVQP